MAAAAAPPAGGEAAGAGERAAGAAVWAAAGAAVAGDARWPAAGELCPSLPNASPLRPEKHERICSAEPLESGGELAAVGSSRMSASKCTLAVNPLGSSECE